MELRQLEYFRAIADTGSINEAAKRLHMSQPPLSYQMKQLEGELGVQLLERTCKGVSLTEAGELLYVRAENILQYAQSASIEVTNIGKSRVLRIGMTPTSVTIMMPYLSQFSKAFPQMRFEVRDGSTFTLSSLLADGIIEVSAMRTPVKLEGMESRTLLHDHMIAVSASPLPQAQNGTILPQHLTQLPLILYRRYENFILDAFHARGLSPQVFCVCDDVWDALLWVKNQLATAIVPHSMQELCNGLYVYDIADPSLDTDILLVWQKSRRPSQTLREFLKICKADENGYNSYGLSQTGEGQVVGQTP